MARPAQFDRDDVIHKAMEAFWEQGYCATSMANLVEATQLRPGSLYAAFESKEGLFLAALDQYSERSVEKLRLALNNAESPSAAIRHYFLTLARKIEDQNDKTSCFVVNTVLELAQRDDKIRARIKQHFDTIESLFVDALKHATELGEIDSDRDIHALAALLMTNIWGLRVLAGTDPQPGRATTIARQIGALL